ncbi:MAG: FUSC family protein, partial [Alphaproteobacteria bacterium]|nr:FUSC family protein [Alphaproteobacteria bacterium]
HDIGLLHLIEHLEQAVDMTRRLLDVGRIPHTHAPLAAACARTFRRAGGILLQEVDPDVVAEDMPQLDAAMIAGGRIADSAAMHAADTAPTDDDKGEEALETVRRTFPIMALSHIAMWIDAGAATALGASRSVVATETTPELRTVSDQPTAVIHRMGRILSHGLDPDGVIFRNSVRAGAAMSLAIVIAKVVPVEHGFWVALAALLVLHSSAASTTATALQAVAGTLIGVVISAGILWLFGKNPTILWILLFVGTFLSAYTPDTVSFMVGQTCFTITVVVFFTLIDTVGISADVARLETVALGAASGAVMAFILWPHGAREALARAVAAVYRAASDGLRITMTDTEQRQDASVEMHGARRHAEEAFTIALSERGRRINTHAWMSLFRAPNMAHSLIVGLWGTPSPWLVEHCRDATDATIAHRGRVADALQRVADRLYGIDAAPAPPAAAGKDQDLAAILTDCLDRARPFGPDKVDDIRILIALNEWISYVEEDIGAAEPDLAYVAQTSQRRAWMHWSLPKSAAPPRPTD